MSERHVADLPRHNGGRSATATDPVIQGSMEGGGVSETEPPEIPELIVAFLKWRAIHHGTLYGRSNLVQFG